METLLIGIIVVLLLMFVLLEHLHWVRMNEEISYWSREAKRSYRRGFDDASEVFLETQIIRDLEE